MDKEGAGLGLIGDGAAAADVARLRQAQDAGGIHLFELGPDGVARCDDGLRALFGLAPGTRFDQATWLSCLYADDRDRVLAEFIRLAHEGGTTDVEYRVRHRDGRLRWVRTRARSAATCELTGPAFGVTTDITEQREAVAALARSKAELEELVEERTRDLRETQARLAHAQRMEALGQLAGGIAHDFNNVLQATLGAASLIERRAGDPEVVRDMVQKVTEAAERGASVTRRLLAFARRGELRAEPLHPPALLASMREILVSTLGAGFEIGVAADNDLPPLLADKGQLETVLVNLATNARDAMEDGTGTLTLTASTETLTRDDDPAHPVALKVGAYVRLAVSDTGYGMNAATLARASEPFFTTKAPGKGTGLGLAMARGFAEQSGGGLRIESAPGHGTTVTLWLPVARIDAEPVVEPEHTASPPGVEVPRVLLVDDEDLVREVLAQHLTDRGYTVVQAPEGITALALLDAGEPIDALVSDLSMPLMNGLALIREARQRRPGLPALLLTGFATEETEFEAHGGDDGGFSLLRKPVTGADLATGVAALLAVASETP